MNRGLVPIKKKDPRTYDYHRTFGSVSLDVIPAEFNFDTSGVMPNQNAEGFPNGCTAYTTTGMASNNDKANYDDKKFTYEKTKLEMGVEGDVPCDQMTSLKSATVWGVRSKGQGDAEALGHRQAPYFIVKKLNGSYYEGIVSAMWKKQGTLSIGSPWLPVFETVGSDGIIPPFLAPKDFTEGHNWEVVGVKDNRLICKSWQGPFWGDKGYCYFSKGQIDGLLSVSGIGVFGQKHLEPGQDVQTVQFDILSTIIHLLQQWLNKL